MLCTSGFVNDVMFSYHGANGPESSTTLCLEEGHQVAVLVGCQITRLQSRSSECGPGVKSALCLHFVNAGGMCCVLLGSVCSSANHGSVPSDAILYYAGQSLFSCVAIINNNQ